METSDSLALAVADLLGEKSQDGIFNNEYLDGICDTGFTAQKGS